MRPPIVRLMILALGMGFGVSLVVPWVCYPLYGEVECFPGYLSLVAIMPWMIKSVLEEGDFRYLPTLLAWAWPIVFWVWCVPIVFLAKSRWNSGVFWVLAAILVVIGVLPIFVNVSMGIEMDFRAGYFIGQTVSLIGVIAVPWGIHRSSSDHGKPHLDQS